MKIEIAGDDQLSTLSAGTHTAQIEAKDSDRFQVSCTCGLLLSDPSAFISTSSHTEAMKVAVAHLFNNWKED